MAESQDEDEAGAGARGVLFMFVVSLSESESESELFNIIPGQAAWEVTRGCRCGLVGELAAEAELVLDLVWVWNPGA